MSRKSEQREIILKTVKSTDIHPDADWIYQQVKKEIPDISLGTVYRNLKLLAGKGNIRQLDIDNGPSHFDGRTDLHHHLKCIKCGRIMDIDYSLKSEDIERIGKENDFSVTEYSFVFYGICSRCIK
jgi:Fur family transcriptional regulator, peroxide stress response regulator